MKNTFFDIFEKFVAQQAKTEFNAKKHNFSLKFHAKNELGHMKLELVQ